MPDNKDTFSKSSSAQKELICKAKKISETFLGERKNLKTRAEDPCS